MVPILVIKTGNGRFVKPDKLVKLDVCGEAISCAIYYDEPTVESTSWFSDRSIVVSFGWDDSHLQKQIITLHELGHIVEKLKYPFSRPKCSAQEYKLYREREAWKYVTKVLGRSRLIGKIIASFWLTYLISAGKLKNIAYWQSKLEEYEAYGTAESSRNLKYWRKALVNK